MNNVLDIISRQSDGCVGILNRSNTILHVRELNENIVFSVGGRHAYVTPD